MCVGQTACALNSYFVSLLGCDLFICSFYSKTGNYRPNSWPEHVSHRPQSYYSLPSGLQ